jgi:hypothetical protein
VPHRRRARELDDERDPPRGAAHGRRACGCWPSRCAATRDVDPTTLVEEDPDGLVFLGLQGMLDPPREGVARGDRRLPPRGQRVVMITGDHAATAAAIARDLGIVDGETEVLTGEDLDASTTSSCATGSTRSRSTPGPHRPTSCASSRPPGRPARRGGHR